MPPDNRVSVDVPDLASEIISNTTLTICVPANHVIVSEDKLEISLKDYHEDVKRRDAWITPLCIALSIALTLTTTKFRDVGFSASTWQAFFLMALVVDTVWLINVLRWRKSAPEIKDIIGSLKAGGKTRTMSPQSAVLQGIARPHMSPSTAVAAILNADPQCSRCGLLFKRTTLQQVCIACGQVN